jgi:hypothetical protein
LASSRRDRKKAPPPSATRVQAQRGYAEARWLQDHLNEALAIWRGASLGEDEVALDAAMASDWDQLPTRMNQALESLYTLEAAAPDTATARTARELADALNQTRGAVDARAGAHHDYLQATIEDGGAPEHSAELVAARDREIRSSTALATARAQLTDALATLSRLT